MKRISAVLAVLWAMVTLVPTLGYAQSEKEGIAVSKEADEQRIKAHSKEDREKALQKYRQALEIFRRTGSKWQGSTLNKIALVHEGMSQYRQALEYYEKGLEVHMKDGNVKGQGTNLANMGSVYARLGEYQKALECQEKALALHRKISNLQGEGWALGGIGQTYQEMGQYHKAMDYHEKSLEISKQLKNDKDEGVALLRIGHTYKSMGEYQKALESYAKALEIKKSSSDVQGEGYAMGAIGSAYQHLGQYRKALEYQEKALDISRKMGNAKQEGVELNNTAVVYTKLGQYQKALQNYQKALEIYRKTGVVKEEAITLTNVGVIYLHQGQYQKALEYCNKALTNQKRIGDSQGEAWSCSTLGNIYHASGQRQRAQENHEKACELYRTIGDRAGESNSFSNIGQVCFGSGQYDEALKNYQKALEIKNKIGTPTAFLKAQIALTYMEKGQLGKAEEVLKGTNSNWALGKLHLLKLQYDMAKTDYEKLLTSAEKSGNVSSLFTAYSGLGKVYEGLEDYKQAEEYYDKGMKLTEEIRSGLLPSERQDFFEVKVNGFDRSEPAKGLTRVRMKMNKASGSIDSSEATRARAFSDNISMRSEGGYSGIPRGILEKEDVLVSKVAALKQELAKTGKQKSPAKHENVSKEIQGAEAELKTFVQMLWDKYRAYASVKYPRPVTLKESSLKPEECVVIFDVSDEGVGAKLIKGKEIRETAYKKWKLNDLEKDVKRFRQSFEQASLRDFDSELAATLYKNLLLRVLVDVPQGTPLVIIPDAILAILPFEALVVSGKATWKEDGPRSYPEGLTFLGDVHPISYYQSITALTLARSLRGRKKPEDRLLVVADPVFRLQDERVQNIKPTQLAMKGGESAPNLMAAIEDESAGGVRFDRLKGTGVLAEDLRKLYGDRADVYTGLKADKEVFLTDIAPHLERYGQIVFATHGVFSTKLPGIKEPVLAMTMVPIGTDGFLKMSDVMGLKLNASAVALTACQTGLGKALSGEGVMSMGRAFQYAGAESILMSLWSVAENASNMLTENFFRQMKEGKSKLDALKLAREEIRKQGFHHPFFWASFILVGEVN